MSLETMFSVGQDDGLFPILPNELEDLFSDDLIHFFKPEELILADTDAVVPAEVNVPRVEAAAPQSSGPSSGGSTSSLTLCPESTALPAQRSTGPSAKSGCKKTQPGPLRLVTTEAPPAEAGAKEAVTEHSPQAAAASPNAAASDNMVDTDSEDSNFTEDDAMNTDEPAQPTTTKVNKRKAPEIDWRSIEDPAERRRQRRLAKNRVTAARSRERKKVQWADMELKLSAVQNENRELKTMLDRLSRENNDLRNQLAMIAPGTTAGMRGNSYSNAEPAALVFITTMLLLCCVLPADKVVLLGSSVPLVVLALLPSGNGKAMSDALPWFSSSIKLLLPSSLKGVQRMVDSTLYRWQFYRETVSVTDRLSTAVWSSHAWQRLSSACTALV